MAKCKVLAPLLAATAMGYFDGGGSQRRLRATQTYMTPFLDIVPHSQLDDLRASFRELDAHLASPRFRLRATFDTYSRHVKGKRLWMATKYYRNVAALDKFEAFIETLDPFFVGVAYFHGDIVISRNSSPLPETYTDKFVISTMTDSIRSSLDVFAKFLAWYFWLPGKENIGFGYESLVLPLRGICAPVADKCNFVLKSPEYQLIKAYRDADKHIGQGKRTITLVPSGIGFKLTMQSPDRLDIPQLQDACADMLNQLNDLVHLSVAELQRWTLGFGAPDDKLLEESGDGTLKLASQE